MASLAKKHKLSQWSHTEIEYLHEHASAQSVAKLAAYLKRPYMSVLEMLSQFGFTAKSGRYPWTPKKVIYLLDNWHTQSRDELAKNLDCPTGVLAAKGHALGLKKTGEQRVFKGNGVYTYWTPEADAFLLANYRKLSTRQIAKVIGKTRHEISRRAQKLGIYAEWVNPDKWTEEEDQYLLDNWPAKTKKEIAATLNKSEKSVQGRIVLYTGVEKKVVGENLKKGKWTQEEKQFLIDNYPTQCMSYLAVHLNRRKDTIYVMVRKLKLKRTDEQRKLIAQSTEALTDGRLIYQLGREGKSNGENRELYAQFPSLINLKRGEIFRTFAWGVKKAIL